MYINVNGVNPVPSKKKTVSGDLWIRYDDANFANSNLEPRLVEFFFEIFPDSSRFPNRRGRKFQRGERIYNVPREKQIAHRMCAGRPACAMPKQPKRQPSSLHVYLFRSYSFQSMRWRSYPWSHSGIQPQATAFDTLTNILAVPELQKTESLLTNLQRTRKGSNWNFCIQVTQFNCQKKHHATKLQSCLEFCPTLSRFDRYHHRLTA